MARPLLPILLAAAALAGAAQDPALRESLAQAKSLWSNQGDREAASARLEQVVAALEPRARELDPAWRRVLCEAWNWLAVLDDRSPAQRPRAARDLESIVDLDPDFEVDRSLTPTRLQAHFDGLRSARLVKVQLILQPEDGTLTLDGRPTPAQAVKHLPLGRHTLAYRRPGHRTVEADLDAVAGSAPVVDLTLQRTSATFRLHVSPAGAEVFLDGRSLGPAGGTAGPEAAPLAVEAGVRLEDLSAPFLLSDLPPGDHVLELKAPCHLPRSIQLPKDLVRTFQDHRLVPYRLEPARGTLALSSAWPGGEVWLNGERRGSLPLAPLALCPGTYALEVRFPSGGFTRTVALEHGGSVALAVKPRPRLAFLGLEGEDDFVGRNRLLERIQGLGERMETLAWLPRPGTGAPQELLARLRAGREAELFLRVEARREGAATLVEVVLATPDSEEERLPIKPLEADPLAALVARLNHPPALTVPWAGVSLLDLPGQPGPWVLEADAAAQKAGLQAGQPILAVDGRPVAGVAAFRAALAAAPEGRVKVAQPGGEATLAVERAPVELPLADPAFSYAGLLADLRLRLQGATGREAALLRFQQALALMHFRKYERAAELLREVRDAGAAGVGQGTVEYTTGLCLLRLGGAYIPEAIQAFTAALGYPGATLTGPEGPRVAPLARQAIDELRVQ